MANAALRSPGNADVLTNQANNFDNLAIALVLRHRMDDAESAFVAAKEIRARLVSDHPASLDYRFQYAGILNDLAIFSNRRQQFDAALAYLNQSLEIYREMCAASPFVITYQDRLAATLVNLSDTWYQKSELKPSESVPQDLASAEGASHEAVVIYERLESRDHGNIKWTINLGMSLNSLGNAAGRRGDFEQALTAYQRSVDRLTHVLPQTQKLAQAKYYLQIALWGVADALVHLGRLEESLPIWDCAEESAVDEAMRATFRAERAAVLTQLGR